MRLNIYSLILTLIQLICYIPVRPVYRATLIGTLIDLLHYYHMVVLTVWFLRLVAVHQ